MIALWMLYSIVTASLLGLVAVLLERVARSGGRPARLIWIGAMAGAVVATFAVATGRTSASAAVIPPAESPEQAMQVAGGSIVYTSEPALDAILTPIIVDHSAPPQAAAIPRGPSFLELVSSWISSERPFTAFDTVLLTAWGVMSALAIALIAVSALRLRRRKRGWSEATCDGMPLLVTDGVGPAVVGILKSRIAVPNWLFELDRERRALVIEHERQHLLARDPLAMMGGLLALAALPWNPAVWFMHRQLRRSTEMDCDTRVLRQHPNPREYATLLVDIGARSKGRVLASPALADSPSDLERRVDQILARAANVTKLGVTVRMILCAGLVLAACATPRPRVSVGEARADTISSADLVAVPSRVVDVAVPALSSVTTTDVAVQQVTGVAAAQVAAQSATSQAVASHSVASQALASQALASQAVASEAAASQVRASHSVAAQSITSQAAASQAASTAAVAQVQAAQAVAPTGSPLETLAATIAGRQQASRVQREIRGRVIEDSTELPLADVSVVLLDDSSRTVATAMTPADGAFSFSVVSEGTFHRLKLSKPSYVDVTTTPFANTPGAALDLKVALARRGSSRAAMGGIVAINAFTIMGGRGAGAGVGAGGVPGRGVAAPVGGRGGTPRPSVGQVVPPGSTPPVTAVAPVPPPGRRGGGASGGRGAGQGAIPPGFYGTSPVPGYPNVTALMDRGSAIRGNLTLSNPPLTLTVDSLVQLVAARYPALFADSAVSRGDSVLIAFAFDSTGVVTHTRMLDHLMPRMISDGVTINASGQQSPDRGPAFVLLDVFPELRGRSLRASGHVKGAVTPRGMATKRITLVFGVMGR